MPLTVSITLQDVYTKLRALVVSVVPAGVVVIQGLGNRVAWPPPVPGFVAMTATLNKALRTPVNSWGRSDPAPTSITIEQGMHLRVQLDCFGADSADWAVMLATVLRNEYSVSILAPISPLYADDPIQAALTNSEEQYEQRWIVGANVQYNPVVTNPTQFANAASATLIEINEAFPP